MNMYSTFKDFLYLNEAYTDKDALLSVRRAVSNIYGKFGFFSSLLARLNILEDTNIPTMCTDGKSIWYNPEFVNSMSHDETMFVLAHEVLHCVMGHFLRTKPHKEKWNVACDYAINPLLDGQIGKMPKKGLLDPKFRGMSAEKIYDLLKDEDMPGDVPGSGYGKAIIGEVKDGQVTIKGPGGETIKVDLGKLAGDWKNAARTASRGSGSGLLQRALQQLDKPKVNWKNELRRFVTSICTKTKTIIPNRRFVGSGTYVQGPQKINELGCAVIAIDTSGSIGDKLLAEFASEIKGIFAAQNIRQIYVLSCDDSVTAVSEFQNSNLKLSQMKTVGGGGTAFGPVFDWIKQNLTSRNKKAGIVIYFTDGQGSWPSDNSVADRTIWVISNDTNNSIQVPWGKRIDITSSEGE